MKKITFIINDNEYFKRLYAKVENLEAIMDDLPSFSAVFTLIGPEGSTYPDKYELTTPGGEKLNINDLNGYQKGVVLNGCMSYYGGKRDFEGLGVPCGVIDIQEAFI